MSIPFRCFEENLVGNDYVVGDIHGCFSKLKQKLDDIGFDYERDRLFSTGDLVDRGEESEDFHKWLAKPWFFSVRGNHEQLLIDSFLVGQAAAIHIANGGLWYYSEIDDADKKLYRDVCDELPYFIEVKTKNGSVCIVHAELPIDDFQLLKQESLDEEYDHYKYKSVMLWARHRYDYRIDKMISGVSKVYVGHTPVKEPTTLGNVVYVDTGVCFGYDFNILKIS